ncbi:hypothetical protein F4V89_26800 [Neorhizobium galegae]|nr:hypothetical protein F4V89_26800 [Neorhizobium galegae]
MALSNPTLPEITDGYETQLHHSLGGRVPHGASIQASDTFLESSSTRSLNPILGRALRPNEAQTHVIDL